MRLDTDAAVDSFRRLVEHDRTYARVYHARVERERRGQRTGFSFGLGYAGGVGESDRPAFLKPQAD